MDEVQKMRFACLEQAVRLAPDLADLGQDGIVLLSNEFFAFVKDGTVPQDEADE